MLMYGDGLVLKDILETPNIRVYNFSSLREGFPRLNLMPPHNLGANTELEFDIKYAEYILSNDLIFMNFMTIIMELYYGNSVFLLISHDPWSEVLIESLMKLIQQRYGIIGVSVNVIEDFYYAKDSGFEDFGVINLDQDKEKFTYLDQQFKMAGAENNG